MVQGKDKNRIIELLNFYWSDRRSWRPNMAYEINKYWNLKKNTILMSASYSVTSETQ